MSKHSQDLPLCGQDFSADEQQEHYTEHKDLSLQNLLESKIAKSRRKKYQAMGQALDHLEVTAWINEHFPEVEISQKLLKIWTREYNQFTFGARCHQRLKSILDQYIWQDDNNFDDIPYYVANDDICNEDCEQLDLQYHYDYHSAMSIYYRCELEDFYRGLDHLSYCLTLAECYSTIKPDQDLLILWQDTVKNYAKVKLSNGETNSRLFDDIKEEYDKEEDNKEVIYEQLPTDIKAFVEFKLKSNAECLMIEQSALEPHREADDTEQTNHFLSFAW